MSCTAVSSLVEELELGVGECEGTSLTQSEERGGGEGRGGGGGGGGGESAISRISLQKSPPTWLGGAVLGGANFVWW